MTSPIARIIGALRRCRVCGCTDDAACLGGCAWVTDPLKRGDLCSACRPVVGPFRIDQRVRVGVTRYPAIVTKVRTNSAGQVVGYDVYAQDGTGRPVYNVAPADVVSSWVSHPDHPDVSFGAHRRTVADVDCTCEAGCPTCAGSAYVAVCAEDDENWPCAVVRAYHAGRESAVGPIGEYVVEVDTIGPAGPSGPRCGTVIAVDGDRWHVRTPDRTHTWLAAARAMVVDRIVLGRRAAAAEIAAVLGHPNAILTARHAVELAAPDVNADDWFPAPGSSGDPAGDQPSGPDTVRVWVTCPVCGRPVQAVNGVVCVHLRNPGVPTDNCMGSLRPFTARLTFTVGLPGAGKTTRVQQYVDEDPAHRVRVNRDDLRKMTFDRYINVDETAVTAAQHAYIRTMLALGRDVIVDDTNLEPEHRAALTAIGKEYGAQIEIWDMTDVPLEVCIDRDRARFDRGERYVGEKVIRQMHADWLAASGKP